MTDNKINDLLTGGEPEEKTDQGRKPFHPKFNVREEFALWVREQFPNLKKYAKGGLVYQELEERKDEVYQAALGAVNHGVSSTKACASSRLQSGWHKFQKGFNGQGNPRKRARSLESFVDAVEDLSISLGGNEHYTEAGEFLDGRSYGGSFYGNLRAFVYRDGEENGRDTKYFVFDQAQEINGENPLVLIGELTRLSRRDFEDLQKITKKFKGPETDFIEEVDRMVPEPGTYSYSGFGYGGNSKGILDLPRTNKGYSGGFRNYGAE